jgi:hypothetical protein
MNDEIALLKLTPEQCRALTGILPEDTVTFLREAGVPELVDFRGIEHNFTLDLKPLAGGALRLGIVDRGLYEMAVQPGTGYFGYVFSGPGEPPWVFCNSSVAQFMQCFSASERMLSLVQAGILEGEARGEYVEREIRSIDPDVFRDENNIWSFLVEELYSGVV